MKKTTIALAVAIASLASAAHAAPADGTLYFGGKVGWSSFYKVKDKGHTPSFTEGLNISKDRVGAGLYLGYQANPYLGFELGGDWLGKVKYKSTAENSGSGELRSFGVSPTIKLSYPITDSFDIYTRLGAFIYHNKLKYSTGDTPTALGITSSEGYTSVAPLAALGVQYNINDDFSARLDYQWVNKMKIKDSAAAHGMRIDHDNGFLSLGVSYNFANIKKEKAIAPPVVNTPPVVQNKVERFVLSDDVLFDFGKSTLKATGKDSLNELVSKLGKLDPTSGSAVVVGHTDRIGSDAYNKKLSLARANSVMNYLITQGIPRDSISARGEGKASPITGTKCNGLKGATLKACLAPDRRVEIEVTGTTESVEVISEDTSMYRN